MSDGPLLNDVTRYGTAARAQQQLGRSDTFRSAQDVFSELRAKGESHPIEAVGRELRGLMSWVDNRGDKRTDEATIA